MLSEVETLSLEGLQVCSCTDETTKMSNLKAIKAALRHAATMGFDPYNSHATQARVMERRWKMEAGARKQREREARSEALANQWLAAELQSTGHSRFKQAG